MRHFNYFENGGPAPSSCISCGAVKQLFEVGQLLQGGMAQVCLKCVKELAIFIGYADKEPLESNIKNLQNEIAIRDDQIAKIPNQVDGLINGIRNSVTDFVFAVSYGDNTDKPEPVQDSSKVSSGAEILRKVETRQRKAPSKPSIV